MSGTQLLVSSPLIGADDVEAIARGDDQLEIFTGAGRVTIQVPQEHRAPLLLICNEVLPYIATSDPLTHQLSDNHLELIQPYLGELLDLGLIFRTDKKVQDLNERKLFTFLARRTENPSAAYAEAKARTFHLVGPPSVIDGWQHQYDQQGLSLASSADEAAVVINVIFTLEDLREQSTEHQREQRCWLPVLFSQADVVIGPWVAPGETACPLCNTSGSKDVQEEVIAPSNAWLSLQPASLSWIGGLVVSQSLRVASPIGANHPWSVRTHLDFIRQTHEKRTTWKNPFCSNCRGQRHPRLKWGVQA